MKTDDEEMDSYRENAKAFLQNGFSSVFGIEFDSISLVDLVPFPEVKNFLSSAEETVKNGEMKDAFEDLGKAYSQLLLDCTEPWGRRRSKFSRIHPSSRPNRGHYLDSCDRNNSTINKMVKAVREEMHEFTSNVRELVKMLLLGIDYWDYERFDSCTPNVLALFNGGFDTSWHPKFDTLELTMDDFDFCLNFVIDSTLSAAESMRWRE